MSDTNSNSPLFSIVIPCYNRGELLHRALLSCVRQSYAGFEAIVVDDGSTECIKEVVGSIDDSRIRYFRQTNAGSSAARNTGMALSKGNWISFLDSDDYFYPGKLDKIRSVIAATDADLIVSRAKQNRISGVPWQIPEQILGCDEVLTEFMFSRYQVIPTSTFVVRRSVALKIKFDDTLSIGEDIDYIVRLAGARKKIFMIPDVLVVYDDSETDGRLSRGGHGLEIEDWLEKNRRYFSNKGYYGFRATYLSKHLGRIRPVKTLIDLCMGYIKGGVSLRLLIRRAVRAYTPQFYNSLVIIFLKMDALLKAGK